MVTQKITLNNPERFAEIREIPREKLEAAAYHIEHNYSKRDILDIECGIGEVNVSFK